MLWLERTSPRAFSVRPALRWLFAALTFLFGARTMATASDVAKYFLTLSEPEEGDQVSNLKLQKLVYYAQGFHLALYDAPLFRDDIQAWDHGPVVASLYHSYKEHGSGGIPVPSDFDASAALDEKERNLLDEVWNVYGQFSAWKLRNMTHEEPPWRDTPKGRGSVIDREALRAYFKTQVRSSG
jgi:uncharacterized phage-associated protein